MRPIDLMTALDRLDDGARFAREWANGRERFDGWQLAYIGRVYGVCRVPETTLERHLAWSEGDTCAFYKPTGAREKARVFRYLQRLKAEILKD